MVLEWGTFSSCEWGYRSILSLEGGFFKSGERYVRELGTFGWHHTRT
jgi:hypothetical protein